MNRAKAIDLVFHSAMSAAVLAILTGPLLAFDLGAIPVAFMVLTFVLGMVMLSLVLDGL